MLHQNFPLINMVAGEKRKTKTKLNSVVPRYNEGLRDWQNLFAVKRFRYIEVLFQKFIITGVKKLFVIPRTPLYRGSLYRGSTVTWSNELDETAYKKFILRDPSPLFRT